MVGLLSPARRRLIFGLPIRAAFNSFHMGKTFYTRVIFRAKMYSVYYMKILKYKNYLAMIDGSVGSQAYQHLYLLTDDGSYQDIVKDGQLSCAYFASSIMAIFSLLSSPHATVSGLLKDMNASGWRSIDYLRAGAVLIWSPEEEAGEQHSHVGFYIGNDQAVSNSTAERVPKSHHWTYGTKSDGSPGRAVISIWWHPDLD